MSIQILFSNIIIEIVNIFWKVYNLQRCPLCFLPDFKQWEVVLQRKSEPNAAKMHLEHYY